MKKYDLNGKKVWVAGHNGLVGSAIVRRLKEENCEILTPSRKELDLTNQAETNAWVEKNKPDAIFLAAAKVGGIKANSDFPAEFIYLNTMIASNVIQASYKNKVEKLLFLGSSCIYPKLANQPIKESELLKGALEKNNEWYAIAKITGLKMTEAYRRQYNCDFISAMPTNLYGENDNFDLKTSHVLPALLRKAHEAKISNASEMSVWGSGNPLREFLYVDDLADGLIFIMKNYSDNEHINIGYGADISIKELATTICKIVGFKGELKFDSSMPDGTPRKMMDSSKLLNLGWKPKTSLEEGIKKTYDWYLKNIII